MQNERGPSGLDVMGERIRHHQEMLEEHEHRLNDHEKRIRKEEQHSGVIDESVKNMCRRVDGLTKALWAVAAALGTTALGLIVDLIKSKF